MNLHYLLLIPLFVAGVITGCADSESEAPTRGVGVLSDYATDAGQTFHVVGVFRVNAIASVVQIILEGHGYVLYNGYREGGIVHSASCPHASHPGMGEIY